MQNILIISDNFNFMLNNMEERLKEKEYTIYHSGTSINEINSLKQQIPSTESIDVILLALSEELVSDHEKVVFIRDKAVEEDIKMFLLGEANDIAGARKIISDHIIEGTFARPIDVGSVVQTVDEYIRQYGKQNKKKILVVDDSGAMLRNVKGWLEDKYQVYLANSGAMAIKYLSLNRPDLVLLDYEMPIVDGKQVLEMIRSEVDFSDTPVIFLTSKNDKESIMKVMDLKPEGYLLKTMKPEEIVKSVDSFFEKQKHI